ncbi:MAG: diversity-generating retroelement protein Avd, partial [Pseudomonadota bacterium]
FLLGDRMQATALDVLEALIEATYTRDRQRHLTRANLGIEKLRVFFRIATEFEYVSTRRYEHACRALDEIGRLVGGWAKASGQRYDDAFARGGHAHYNDLHQANQAGKV